MELTSKHRKYLRALAHSLKSYINIGKNGINPSSIKAINQLLDSHELIKIKITKGNKKELGQVIETKTNSFIVGSIGSILIIYKKTKSKKDSTIVLPND